MPEQPCEQTHGSYEYGRWKEIKNLFAQALSIPPTAREPWLAQICGADDVLHDGVRRLLAEYYSAPGFMEPCDIETSPTPSLPSGTMLAERFEILRQIGRGGMGEVYEVFDTTLGERFALKTLRRDLGFETGSTSRFRRELLLTRQITHPNVCRVSEFHETRDSSGQPLSFFTMELLVGATLAERISTKGRIDRIEALPLIRQIAAGLNEVHRLGIVHRDLKPSNIMLVDEPTGSHRVVLMDFGLARSSRPGALSDTRTGMLLGTPAYMAPEQFRKGIVTPACDIYAFGVTMFEMLTGRSHPLFSPRSGSPDLDAQFEEILSRCLDADPLKRPKSAGEIIEALEGPDPTKRVLLPVVIAVAASIGVFGLAIGLWNNRAPGVQRSAVITKLTFDKGMTIDPAATPDGKVLVYASDRGTRGDLNIWMERSGTGEPIQLTDDPGNEDQPSISPDGKLVAYHSQRDNTLYLKVLGSRYARPLAKWGQNPQFSPDGRQIAYWTGQEGELGDSNGQIWTIPVVGGPPRRLASDFWEARYPSWSPNSKRILFEGARSWRSSGQEERELWLATIAGTEVTPTGLGERLKANSLRLHDSPAAWNGKRLVFAARNDQTTNLWQTEMSDGRSRVSRNPERLTTSTQLELTPALMSDGRVVYASLLNNVDVWRISTRSGALSAVTQGEAANTTPTVSRDGRRLLYGRRLGEARDIWWMDLMTRKHHSIIKDQLAVSWISPDGRRAAYSVQNRISVLDIDSGREMVWCPDCGEVAGWLPDNSAVLFRNENQPGRSEFASLDIKNGSRRTILSGNGLRDAAISPDRKLIAYAVQQNGIQSRIYLKHLEGGPSEAPVPATGPDTWSDHPAWSDNGSVLFYSSERDGFLCIWRQRIDRTRLTPIGLPLILSHFHLARFTPSLISRSVFGMSVAGDFLFLNVGAANGNIYAIRN
jgi:eukaryotic-like serine/threonine-protein kinase